VRKQDFPPTVYIYKFYFIYIISKRTKMFQLLLLNAFNIFFLLFFSCRFAKKKRINKYQKKGKLYTLYISGHSKRIFLYTSTIPDNFGVCFFLYIIYAGQQEEFYKQLNTTSRNTIKELARLEYIYLFCGEILRGGHDRVNSDNKVYIHSTKN
jgi:hypothetical protein